MNFSKLLCLVLVYSQQLGQVLAEGTPECEGETAGTTVPCNGKKGGALKLKVTGALTGSVSLATWQKGVADITASNKYEMVNKDLTIKTLDEPDEGEYKATNVSPEQKFEVKVVDCLGGTSTTPAMCKGKKGKSIKLGLKKGTVESIKWKKGKDTILADNSKYPGGVTGATLTINNLADDDEAKFTGGADGDEEHFSVQVAPVCLSTDTTCVGKLSRDLVLKVLGTVDSMVTWKKDGTPLTDARYVKSGTNKVELMIPNLVPTDAGTYDAEYGATTVTVPFTVSIADPKGAGRSTTTKKAPTTLSGGGGLSYSPALLVTVTLVHLLLQLAA